MVVVLSPTALSKGVLLLLSVHYVERNATFFKNEMGDPKVSVPIYVPI